MIPSSFFGQSQILICQRKDRSQIQIIFKKGTNKEMQESRHCSMRAVCLEEMLPLGADHQALHQGRVGEESLRKSENHKAVEIIDTIIHLSSPKHRQRHPVHPPADWLIVKY